MCDASEAVASCLKMVLTRLTWPQREMYSTRKCKWNQTYWQETVKKSVQYPLASDFTLTWGKGAVRQCLYSFNHAQKAHCVISPNLQSGVRPPACSSRNTVQPAAWKSSKSRAVGYMSIMASWYFHRKLAGYLRWVLLSGLVITHRLPHKQKHQNITLELQTWQGNLKLCLAGWWG